MLIACTHILEVCIGIQLGCIRRPSISLFYLFNMSMFCPSFLYVYSLRPFFFFFFCSLHARLGFIFNLVDVPRTCI